MGPAHHQSQSQLIAKLPPICLGNVALSMHVISSVYALKQRRKEDESVLCCLETIIYTEMTNNLDAEFCWVDSSC